MRTGSGIATLFLTGFVSDRFLAAQARHSALGSRCHLPTMPLMYPAGLSRSGIVTASRGIGMSGMVSIP